MSNTKFTLILILTLFTFNLQAKPPLKNYTRVTECLCPKKIQLGTKVTDNRGKEIDPRLCGKELQPHQNVHPSDKICESDRIYICKFGSSHAINSYQNDCQDDKICYMTNVFNQFMSIDDTKQYVRRCFEKNYCNKTTSSCGPLPTWV